MAHVVWLKRDLRTLDHVPLARAARLGAVVVLYAYEPDVYAAPEHDPSHFEFVDRSLAELDERLRAYGGRLTYRAGAMPDVLHRLVADGLAIESLWSHEETGTDATFRRDRHVAAWCRERGVRWTEIPQFGVFRAQPSRDGWAKRWERRMSEPLEPEPEAIRFAVLAPEHRRSGHELGLAPSSKPGAQPGGSTHASSVLRGFLLERGANYRADMASPLAGASGCSRMSAHLAYGTISLRRVYRETREREAALRAAVETGERIDRRWLASLTSYRARLHWHCHFIQKLEDQPSLEFVNQSRSYDGLRENDFDEARFAAWTEGRTGFPMIDACMRALHHDGWINFRMRAMLMSFASYHLWLHWRPTAVYLARHFLDFEPGIHYPQSQMQSGVTGINAIRIYSPGKQALDNDPTGAFIRHHVPELARVPLAYLAEPHRMPPLIALETGFRPGVDYPSPIVDHLTAVAEAKARIYTIRRSAASRAEAAGVYELHGSRKPAPPSRARRPARRERAQDDG